MNVASVFDRFGRRHVVGAFWFLPILRIGPTPAPRHLWLYQASTLDARLVLAPQSLKQPNSRAILQ
jgi:hypothetical protein